MGIELDGKAWKNIDIVATETPLESSFKNEIDVLAKVDCLLSDPFVPMPWQKKVKKFCKAVAKLDKMKLDAIEKACYPLKVSLRMREMCSSTPSPEMWIIQDTLAWCTLIWTIMENRWGDSGEIQLAIHSWDSNCQGRPTMAPFFSRKDTFLISV